MAAARRPDGQVGNETAESAGEDQESKQPETGRLALYPGDAARKPNPDGEEQTRQIAEMAVEVRRQAVSGAMKHRRSVNDPRAAGQERNDAAERHYDLKEAPLQAQTLNRNSMMSPSWTT